MFHSPFASRPATTPQPGGLYRQVGAETRVSGATPHQLVALLFEAYMEALAQARGAMREDRRVEKGVALGRAVRILEEGLRAGLDLRSGGPLARDLDELYHYLTRRLTLANLHDDEAALDECRRLVLPLQEAWASIGPSVDTAPAGR
ncbi:MAG: flagellar export chaperone FliS [Ideonella sp. WA131b]|jgi:flagellar protein FliS|nr:flagellar export chaperone FliS [Ideonella sp. WA131b]